MEGERRYLMAKYKEVSSYFLKWDFSDRQIGGTSLLNQDLGLGIQYWVLGIMVRAIGYGM